MAPAMLLLIFVVAEKTAGAAYAGGHKPVIGAAEVGYLPVEEATHGATASCFLLLASCFLLP